MQQNSKNVQFKRWWKYKYHKKYSIYNKPNNLGSEWVILYPMMLCGTRPVKDESMCLSSRENDVAAIDVNMGCPKEYSTKVSLLSVTYQLLRPLADLWLISCWPLTDLWTLAGRDGSRSSLWPWQDRGGEYFSQTTRQTIKVVDVQLTCWEHINVNFKMNFNL